MEPLKISCDTADCGNNLHCFRKSTKMKFPEGSCKYCGENLVDWERVKKREIKDAKNTFGELKKEWIRHHYWHVELPKRAINYALRKGKINLKDAVIKRLKSSVQPIKPFHDGFQTPFESNNPIYYGQHANAICCRKCIEYWHGIPSTKPISEKEILYFAELIILYLTEKIPNLKEYPQKIPPIRDN